ncbi:MAG: tyrosine--tRNA ligase [Candidatus Lariskella arthropodorum]
MKSEILRILQTRGFLYQNTNIQDLDNLTHNSEVVLYCGFDCTAKSLHVGNLVNIMILRWFQKLGHTPIVLVGGATTMIGDPSGKSDARTMLSYETIQENKESISTVFERFINFDKAHFVDNNDWLCEIKYLEFLRDYGRHFSVNKMLTFESVKSRLDAEQSISFLEFNYMLLQAYDFLELYKRFGCRLQVGGSDQWGNIVNGVWLAHKVIDKELFGLTCPLITMASGAKMGKSASGAVWLNSSMKSPYDYWQFWRNTEDTDVIRFLRLFTELDEQEIERLSKLKGAEINDAKIILANEATKLCHGEEASEKAFNTASKAFERSSELSIDDLPKINISKQDIEYGIKFLQLFVMTGLAESNSAAKKLIIGGGAKYNNKVIQDPSQQVSIVDFLNGKIVLLAGKKRYAIAVYTEPL